MGTKELILQKTLMLLGKKGFSGVSVTDIQQETGIARGLLYHYFINQNQLFEEAVEYLVEKWSISREKIKDCSISELIVRVIARYQRLSEDVRLNGEAKVSLVQLYLLLLEVSYRSEAIATKFKQLNNDRSYCWKTAVLNSFSRGELRSGLNLESVAKHFLYLEEGAFLFSGTMKRDEELIYNLEKTLGEFYEIVKR